MSPPIHDVVERVPGEGAPVRVWLEDGTEAAAIFSMHWWDEARARYIRPHPVRWQMKHGPGVGNAPGPGERQPELGLALVSEHGLGQA
jgi:hypothetical protein